MFDEQASGRVPQGVEAIFCLAVDREAGPLLQWIEHSPHQVHPCLDAAALVGKHEIKLAPQTCGTPRAQRVDGHRGERNIPASGTALRRADVPPRVGALANMDNAIDEVAISPPKSPRLRDAQPCEYQRHDEG